MAKKLHNVLTLADPEAYQLEDSIQNLLHQFAAKQIETIYELVLKQMQITPEQAELLTEQQFLSLVSEHGISINHIAPGDAGHPRNGYYIKVNGLLMAFVSDPQFKGSEIKFEIKERAA